MSFIGRIKEKNQLEKAWESQDAFVLISGQQHVGKSALIQEFSKDKEVLYFSAINQSDYLNRQYFKECCMAFCEKESDQRKVFSWKEIINFFVSDKETQERKVLILDNVHFLIQSNPNFLNILKNIWRNSLKNNFVMLVVVVPNGKVLQHHAFRNKSFYNHITLRIDVQPLKFVEIMKDYAHQEFNQLMMLYCIAGGAPRHWNYFQDCLSKKSFEKVVDELFFHPYGNLFQEPGRWIEKEVENTSIAHSILLALSKGNTKSIQISAYSGIKLSKVQKYIDLFQSLQFVKINNSTIDKKRWNGKNVDYYIADPLLDFWYTFVFPFMNNILFEDEYAKLYFEKHFNTYCKRWFKMIALDIFRVANQQNSLYYECDQIGTIRDNSGRTIDVVGIDSQKKYIFLGDCYFGNLHYTRKQFDEFTQKCAEMKEMKEMKAYKNYKFIYGVCSNMPFEEALIDFALLSKNIMLFNGITLYALNA